MEEADLDQIGSNLSTAWHESGPRSASYKGFSFGLMNPFIGKRIRSLRREKGLSQEKVAELAHMSRPTYRRYEAGQIAKVDGLEQIATALGVTSYELIVSADTEGESGRAGEPAIVPVEEARSLLSELRGLSDVQRRNFFAHMHGYLAALKGR